MAIQFFICQIIIDSRHAGVTFEGQFFTITVRNSIVCAHTHTTSHQIENKISMSIVCRILYTIFFIIFLIV